nr:hypothetical protein [Oculatellaceae cyanobacterium Prado106]
VPFHKPTIYLFPGGDGASAVFGVRGLTLLIDGGYARQTSNWQFVRHLDRVDAVLVSHLGVDNLFGVTSLIDRISSAGDIQTSFGPVYFNTCPSSPSKSGSAVDPLLLSLSDVGSSLVNKLQKVDLTVLPCTATANGQPVNLYFKIGFGSVDMYVLNPAESGGASSKTAKGGNAVESCVASIVVFKPAAPGTKPVRVLLSLIQYFG